MAQSVRNVCDLLRNDLMRADCDEALVEAHRGDVVERTSQSLNEHLPLYGMLFVLGGEVAHLVRHLSRLCSCLNVSEEVEQGSWTICGGAMGEL